MSFQKLRFQRKQWETIKFFSFWKTKELLQMSAEWSSLFCRRKTSGITGMESSFHPSTTEESDFNDQHTKVITNNQKFRLYTIKLLFRNQFSVCILFYFMHLSLYILDSGTDARRGESRQQAFNKMRHPCFRTVSLKWPQLNMTFGTAASSVHCHSHFSGFLHVSTN